LDDPSDAVESLEKALLQNNTKDNFTNIVVRLKGWRKFPHIDISQKLRHHGVDRILGRKFQVPKFLSDYLEISSHSKLGTSENVQKDLYRKIFNFFDEDVDGAISSKDFEKNLEKLGIFMHEDEIQTMFKVMDANGNGKVTFEGEEGRFLHPMLIFFPRVSQIPRITRRDFQSIL